MANQSLLLALELQREDLQAIGESMKGKQRADEKTDLDIALEIYQNELDTVSNHAYDREMALSIARAVLSDASIIIEAQEAEDQAERDHRFAMSLSGNGNEQVPRHSTERMDETLDDQLIEYLQALNIEEPEDQPESSSWAASRKPEAVRECIACGDEFPPFALSRSPCSHEYCRKCLVGLVRSSLQDESLFPPRCCRLPIPVTTGGKWFSPEIVGQFRAKKLEYETPNRTYCSKPTCSTFVPPAFITGEVAHCPKCSQKTCTHCKGRQHTGICREDDASQQLLQLAAENGWQSCNSCRRMVELNTGCYHMTCPCGAQFCYVCGVPWKNCTCPQWEEGHLLQRANDIVDRDAGDRINALERHRRVQLERVNLIENHECDHERWKGRPGPRECEECNQVLPVFIYECRQCHVMACRRCRFNRL
jgi:hypothetical protein